MSCNKAHNAPFFRLCGHVPFQSDSPAKLEEVIMQGELKFSEIEWINVSQSGWYCRVVGGPVYIVKLVMII